MPSKDEAGNRLAHSHFGIEPGISRIFRIREAGANEERLNSSIKLLEVNADSFAVGIMPLLFGPAPSIGIPFPVTIVEITPDEFEKLQSGDLELPSGWTIAEELMRAA